VEGEEGILQLDLLEEEERSIVFFLRQTLQREGTRRIAEQNRFVLLRTGTTRLKDKRIGNRVCIGISMGLARSNDACCSVKLCDRYLYAE
jgi:hypothetical protein